MKIRAVRPDFFSDRTMTGLDPMVRLLYIGLWCYVDDEGRGEWLPKLIEASVFPMEPVDIDALLGALTETGRVVRYEVGDRDYFHIPKFSDYQKFGGRVTASRLPAPPSAVRPVSVRRTSAVLPVEVLEGESEAEAEGESEVALRGAKPAWDWLTNPDNPIHLPATNGNARRIGKFNREISEQLTAEGIPEGDWGMVLSERARVWPDHFGDATLTPEALMKHLAALGRPPMRGDPKQMRRQAIRKQQLAAESGGT